MAASTLYEAVEPHIVWKQLLAAIVADIIGDGSEVGVRDESFTLASIARLTKFAGHSLGDVHIKNLLISRRRDSNYPLTYCILSYSRCRKCWDLYLFSYYPSHLVRL
jgi:hypothetical protein